MNNSLSPPKEPRGKNPAGKDLLLPVWWRVLGAGQGLTGANTLEMGKVPGFVTSLGGCEERDGQIRKRSKAAVIGATYLGKARNS